MKELLLLPQSKINVLKVVSYIGHDQLRYAELVDYTIDNKLITANKASWVISHCYDNNVGYFEEFLPKLLPILKDENYSDSIKRNLVRVLQFVEIPEIHHAEVIDSCFELLYNKNSATALLAFSMSVLYKMCVIYPDLKNELKLTIENILPRATSGVKNRGNKILKLIS